MRHCFPGYVLLEQVMAMALMTMLFATMVHFIVAASHRMQDINDRITAQQEHRIMRQIIQYHLTLPCPTGKQLLLDQRQSPVLKTCYRHQPARLQVGCQHQYCQLQLKPQGQRAISLLNSDSAWQVMLCDQGACEPYTGQLVLGMTLHVVIDTTYHHHHLVSDFAVEVV